MPSTARVAERALQPNVLLPVENFSTSTAAPCKTEKFHQFATRLARNLLAPVLTFNTRVAVACAGVKGISAISNAQDRTEAKNTCRDSSLSILQRGVISRLASDDTQ